MCSINNENFRAKLELDLKARVYNQGRTQGRVSGVETPPFCKQKQCYLWMM